MQRNAHCVSSRNIPTCERSRRCRCRLNRLATCSC